MSTVIGFGLACLVTQSGGWDWIGRRAVIIRTLVVAILNLGSFFSSLILSQIFERNFLFFRNGSLGSLGITLHVEFFFVQTIWSRFSPEKKRNRVFGSQYQLILVRQRSNPRPGTTRTLCPKELRHFKQKENGPTTPCIQCDVSRNPYLVMIWASVYQDAKEQCCWDSWLRVHPQSLKQRKFILKSIPRRATVTAVQNPVFLLFFCYLRTDAGPNV